MSERYSPDQTTFFLSMASNLAAGWTGPKVAERLPEELQALLGRHAPQLG